MRKGFTMSGDCFESLGFMVAAGLLVMTSWSNSLAAGPELPDSNRKFGSTMNEDENNILVCGSGKNMTSQEYKKAVLHLLDARPGLLIQEVGLPDPVVFRSKVATTWGKYEEYFGSNQTAAMKALLDAGTDPLTITIEACRERGVWIAASFRMSSYDWYDKQLDIYEFGRKHKHLKIPGRAALDPVHPEVYAHRMAIFTEVANEYDIDGIVFNFIRQAFQLISDPHNNHPVLTRMVADTRKMLDEVAKKKGRKRLLLGVQRQGRCVHHERGMEAPQ